VPINLYGTWNVAYFVKQYIFIRFNDDETLATKICGKPFGADEGTRVCILVKFGV
jgi:hypothetical protein